MKRVKSSSVGCFSLSIAQNSEESWILIQAPQQDGMDCDSSRAGPLSWHFHIFSL